MREAYAEIVLDHSRGRRCEPLIVRPTAEELFGRHADGHAVETAYHGFGAFSHRLGCSEFAELAQRPAACAYTIPTANTTRSYNATCDPRRSHCYSMTEEVEPAAQPLWCCDFTETTAVASEHVLFSFNDASRLSDDRLGNLTLATHHVLPVARTSAGFRLESPLNGSNPRLLVSVWAGFVRETRVAAEAADLGPKKHLTQVSVWGAYGPFDVRMLANFNADAAAAAAAATASATANARAAATAVASGGQSSGAQASAAERAALFAEAAAKREWGAWQGLPLLGAAEQPPATIARRRDALRRMAGDAPEMGLGGGSGTCVISTATGAAYNGSLPLGAALLRNKREFCEACGYRCILSTGGEHSTRRPAKWDKILALHDALRSCRVVLHVDADVIVRQPFRLEPLAHTWLSATRDFDGFNSGVMLVKRTRQARDLLDFAWRQASFTHSFSAEQNALRLGLRRPYPASSRSRIGMVSILEGLVEYSFFDSPMLGKLGRDLNATPPLYHAAGCTANRGRVESGACDDMLLKRIPPAGALRSMGRGGAACPSIETSHIPRGRALNQHLQSTGPTSLGRRWLRGRDVRIKHTDQKGATQDGWWERHPGCTRNAGCDDPDARKRKQHRAAA